MRNPASTMHLGAIPRGLPFAAVLLALLLIPSAGLYGRGTAQRHKSVPSGKLTGTVLGLDGKPAAKARVMAQTSDGRSPRTARTDAEGHFQLTCPTGPVDVRARAGENWSEWVRNVRVRTDETTSITIQITAQPAPQTQKTGSSPQLPR